jgi:sensor c-di-GMP phosphodiesterase-like protein
MIRSLAVVALARGLDMSVTAEGVETAEQLDGLKRSASTLRKAICSAVRFRLQSWNFSR